MSTQVMVPGILVALKTSVNGGVQYQRRDTGGDDEGRIKQWETTRMMDDPAEHTAAVEVSGKASRIVSKLCVRTSFGLLCPTDREQELDEAVVAMREMATEWNRKAQHSFVNVSAIKGRIADNDEEAIRAILQEARELMDRMDKGLADADVKVIRDAALRAKRLSQMMVPGASEQVNVAVAAAREAAKAIVKRGDDMRDIAATALVDAERLTFDAARFSFLEAVETTMESLPSVDLQRGAELEIDAEQQVEEVAS